MTRATVGLLTLLTLGCTRDDSTSGRGITDGIAELPPPSPTLSRFDVPLDYDFSPILREVEKAVPMTLGSLDSLHQMGDNERQHYAYEIKRGPFTTFMLGSQ